MISLSDCESKSRNISDTLRIYLYLESGFRCPMPVENHDDVTTPIALLIHHIEPWIINKKHDPCNMIAICSNCHTAIHKGFISEDYVVQQKKILTSLPLNKNILDSNQLNLLTVLNMEGMLGKLYEILTTAMNIIEERHRGSQLIPQLLYYRIRTLRKMGDPKRKLTKRLLRVCL